MNSEAVNLARSLTSEPLQNVDLVPALCELLAEAPYLKLNPSARRKGAQERVSRAHEGDTHWSPLVQNWIHSLRAHPTQTRTGSTTSVPPSISDEFIYEQS